MMRITTILSVVLFAIGAAAQAPTWHEILPDPDWNSRYDDVFFLNENLGWAVGNHGGYVFKTVDGGLNWDLQLELGEETYIRNVEFLNPNIGFLGTLGDGFYKTIDGGENWTLIEQDIIPDPQFPFPNNEVFCGLDAVGDHTIYGCGTYFGPAYVVKSVDSGETWQYIDMSAYADALVEVLFVDENVGFASGQSSTGAIILKTIDGGTSWTEIYNSGIPGEYVWKLQRLFSNTNVMFGSVESVAPLNGKLIKSTDNGQSWVSKEVPDTDIQAVGFITENHGWMGGHHTGFLETFDAGTTWTNTEFGGNLNRIQVFSEDLAYCSGGAIYKFSGNLNTKEFGKNTEREKLEVSVAPNPVNNQLNFSVNFKRKDHIILKLYDANGKLLKELKNETISKAEKKNYSFPFPYPAGTYYLNLHNDTGNQAEKIIKTAD